MTTVLLIDDHELIRQGLAGAFAQAEGFEVAGQAGSVADGIALAQRVAPDVVVTDVRLPDGSGLDVVRALRKENRTIGLVVLTMYAGDEQLFAAMDAGASGFVGKDAPTSTVISAARQAAVAPLTFTCTGLAEAMLRRMSSGRPGSPTASARCSSCWPRDSASARSPASSTSASRPPRATSAGSTRSSAPPTGPRRWSPRCGSGLISARSRRPPERRTGRPTASRDGRT